jgi:hypothetical protein
MPEVFDQNGLRVIYPENWEVDENSTDEWPRSVSLQSPNSATWAVYMYDSTLLLEAAKSMQELASEALVAMQGNYDEIEASPALEDILDESAIGYDLNFYCLDLLILARIRVLEMGKFTYLFIAQGEDRDFNDNFAVFNAIRVSVLRASLGI